MKTFLIKSFAFFSIIALVVITGFLLPETPRSKESLLYSIRVKDSLMRNTPKPRMIFIGGSNLSFGLDSRLIEDSLSLHPINTGIHAYLGLKYMMDHVVPLIKPGDLVVLSPEYQHFFGDFIYGGRELLRILAVDNFSERKLLSSKQWSQMSEHILAYCYSKYNPKEYIAYHVEEIYSRQSFNNYGDAYLHWDKKRKPVKPYKGLPGSYNPDAVYLILKFNKQIEERGAKLIFSYPSLQQSSYYNLKTSIDTVEQALSMTDLIILNKPTDYLMPDSLLFNTPYHLTYQGAVYRTELFIRDFKKRQKSK